MKRLFTSESVTEGHPDKVCDRISDSVLDAILAQDPVARVACETSVTTGLVLVMGEITTNCYIDIPRIARDAILDIGYNHSDLGFDGNSCGIITAIGQQSQDIALGVDIEGAGDQGMMFGYACDETKELMPLSISLSHKLAKKMTDIRKANVLPFLRPDGKTQVTVQYGDDGKIERIDTVLISTQHSPEVSQKEIKEAVFEEIIKKTVPENLIDGATKILVNPTGRFVIGGPHGDSGLTGRKIIVDTYGGVARHGGGAFSGKDPTKVDRSAAYMCRYIAKNIVAAGIASRCEIQVSYAIGIAEPTSVTVETFGTSKYTNEQIADAVVSVFDMRPAAIIKALDLRTPIYAPLSAYGHMGREDLGVAWEKTDKTEALLSALS